MLRKGRGALLGPAAPTEARGGKWGAGAGSRSHFVLVPRGARVLAAAGSPRAQRRELESLALGGTGEAPLLMRTRGGGGQREAPT